MIPKECKRLAEVDLPIKIVSDHSISDKYLRNKPTTTLHTWWAQRPLSACRAVLASLLLPDPADPRCPVSFKKAARSRLSEIVGRIRDDDMSLRKGLLTFIGLLSDNSMASKPIMTQAFQALIHEAYDKQPPLVVDPFAGAGSIPFEALRLGCDTFAGDLNPVSVLILKAIIEEIPREKNLGKRLIEAGELLKTKAKSIIGDFYPLDEDGRQPIAYLWGRTVKCETPNCGAEIPLVRSFWLCKKSNKRRALKYVIKREPNTIPSVVFEVFTPKKESEVPRANITRAKATCLCCNTVLHPDRVRAQLREHKGGADVIFDGNGSRIAGARLLAVVTVQPNTIQREYRKANGSDYLSVYNAKKVIDYLGNERAAYDLPWIPDEPIKRVPVPFGVINVWFYGVEKWGDLYATRQKASIAILLKTLREMNDIDDSIRKLLCFVISKYSRHCNANARWNNIVESVEPAFGTPSLPFTWTFPESATWGPWAENYDGSLDSVVKCLEKGFTTISKSGTAEKANAISSPLPDASADVWFTDPPYYDNIPYSYISDFFYVWLRRAIGDKYPDLFRTSLTPKKEELVAYLNEDNDASAARSRFEAGLAEACLEGRRVLTDDGIGCVVFAHKTTEGWEALLSGIISSGWIITASWPLSTERVGRIRARDSAALGASIHLVCRPRSEEAVVGDWSAVLNELPKRVGSWMERLQGEGIRGADLVFACIGPALEIFSRFSKVEMADGKEVTLDVYLEKVWEVVGRLALENVLGTDEAQARNGMAGVLEEDARLTALFLWTLQSTERDITAKDNDTDEDDVDEESDDEGDAPQSKAKGFSLVFDVARRFAQPLGIHLDNWEDRIIETKKGVVRLLSVAERAKALFGDAGASAVAYELETDPAKAAQFELSLGVVEAAPKIKSKGRRGRPAVDVTDDDFSTDQQVTTLDRVHAAMLLQKAGRANALRTLLKAEQQRGTDFLRLANALSALYPKSSEEKRLLDAMLLAVPR